MSSVYMRFDGLGEIINECERIYGSKVVENIDKKIIKECAANAQKEVSRRLKRSKDVSQSGRKGSRTFIHSADAVPVTGVRRKKGKLFVIVGWDLGDNSPYFYTKFNEWGTSERPPTPVFLPVSKEINKELRESGLAEYAKLLNFLER